MRKELDIDEINVLEGTARLGGSQKIYFRILRKFANEKEIMPSLEEANDQANLQRVKEWVHSIKGVAGNLSITRLYNQSAELDGAIKDNAFSIEAYSALIDYYREIKLLILENIPE